MVAQRVRMHNVTDKSQLSYNDNGTKRIAFSIP